MSQPPGEVSVASSTRMGTSALGPEKSAKSHLAARSTSTSAKLRSCTVCRSRKVRCDKLAPCSNCRRANIACTFPSTDRPPRWARRLDRIASNVALDANEPQLTDPAATQVMERLRNLENLVKELSGQLELANATSTSTAGSSSRVESPHSSINGPDKLLQSDPSAISNVKAVQNQFGRMVLKDSNQSRYVSSGFWSKVNDELDDLRVDSSELEASESDTSEDDASPSSTREMQRTPAERHSFLFRHNLSPTAPDLREFHPLPSQIPFFLDVFSENVNTIIHIVHVPTLSKMIRQLRGSDMSSLTPANEALMFSIYYSAITSMEEEDIMTNFGSTKTDLNLKYRLGLEHALAKADFLNVPDLVLVQAFAIFLCLLRRHDSPRFVWMMTGLIIRMGQALGLHRDGAKFKNFTPFEIELRRRAWWILCVLDVRSSEDQGTDFTIANGSFDTKLPLNINDTDISPESTSMPEAREGLTDMSFPIVMCEIGEISKQLMAQIGKEGASGAGAQGRLLDQIYQKLDRGFLQYSENAADIKVWVGIVVTRLVIAKMTLLVYLPILFSPTSEDYSDDIKTKLLIAAIEIAEYNHALNSEPACRQWRWVYQTYTHWYSVVYILIEVSKRPWSPVIERAWVALHSEWLIPPQSSMDKSLRIWVPLRKLTAKAKKHRHTEIEWLRNDAEAAIRLEMEDDKMPIPASSGPFSAGCDAAELFRERWRQLVGMPSKPKQEKQFSGQHSPEVWSPLLQATHRPASIEKFMPNRATGGLENGWIASTKESELHDSQNLLINDTSDIHSNFSSDPSGRSEQGKYPLSVYPDMTDISTDWSMGSGFVPWLWPEVDSTVDDSSIQDANGFDVDMDGEIDWYNWLESTKGMEWGESTGSI